MANWTLTRDPATANQPAPGGILNAEAFQVLVDRGFTEVAQEKFDVVREMEQLVYVENVKFDSGKGTSFPAMGGLVPMNRDEDTPVFASAAPGFPWEYTTQQFRLFFKIPRDAIERDIDIGFVRAKERISEVLDQHQETIEARVADVYNRGDGVGGAGAPLLCPDGCYLLDENRPNPDVRGGTWGNLEATSDITGNSLFQASYNARMGVSPIGRLLSQTIKSMAIPAAAEQQMYVLLSTNQLVGTNWNDASWAAAKFNMDQVKVLSRLTAPLIYYFLNDPKSDANGVRLAKFKDVSAASGWGEGVNPDIYWARIRSAWGLYARDVRATFRGGRLSPVGS